MMDKLDIIVPFEVERAGVEEAIAFIRLEKEKYGFSHFALTGPTKGYRSVGYPKSEVFSGLAKSFCRVREAFSGEGITLSWWCSLTMKSGRLRGAQPPVRTNGTDHPFANCCLDETFRERFVSDVMRFVKIARPELIIFEDDYSICAAAGGYGCFCPLHLAEFERREKRRYEREELLEIFARRDRASVELRRRYRQLSADGMTELSLRMREELDKVAPDTRIMLCEPGSTDSDGGKAGELARALAGKTRPLSRLHGTFYLGGDTKDIPEVLYHSVYMSEHIGENFDFYHETDCYPHTRFFTSAGQMRVFLGTSLASGFVGSLYHVAQIATPLASTVEEPVYSIMLSEERERFTAVSLAARLSERVGVEIPYDPFYNLLTEDGGIPRWLRAVSLFGIPYTTKKSSIAFIDERQTAYFPEEELLRYLSGTLFLDTEGARALIERGLGRYIGVEIGEAVAEGDLLFDLGARDTIQPPYDAYSETANMPTAHAYALNRNGKQYALLPSAHGVKSVVKTYTFEGKFVTDAMTCYENELGGRVFVMGTTLAGNRSQALLNYRRRALIEGIIEESGADFPMVLREPDIYTVFLRAKCPKKAGFSSLLTMANLGGDPVPSLPLYLPEDMRALTPYYCNKEGEWVEASYERSEKGIVLLHALGYCELVYLMFK